MGPSAQRFFEPPQVTAANAAIGDLTKKETAEETQKRARALNDALNNRGLDAVTRAEIQGMYDKGANSATLAQYLADANEGKSGFFKVRKVQQNEREMLKERPGRKQILSLGSNNPLGGGTIV
jgi:hypothetical protein